MSATYSEIYSTKLREQSKILKGESNSPSKTKSKYVTLIKKFKKKERSSSFTKMKVKPRRINTKILKMSKSNFNYKNKTKKKTKSKQKLENSQKLKMDYNTFSQEAKNEEINTINQRKQKYNNANSKSMENYEKNLNDFTTKKKDNDIRSKILFNLDNLNKNNKYEDYIFYKTLQNNNYNNYVKISKTYNDNSFKKYFDIFKLRQQAIKARDEIKYNFLNINKSNMANKIFLKNNTFSDYLPQKTKTLFKARKLKEELENTINGNYRAYSSQPLRNKQNNFLNGALKEKKENNKNDGNYGKNNDNDKSEVNNFSYHFFDKNIKMPKKIKKYTNCTNTEISKTINENNIKEKHEKKNDKNIFRNKTNISTDNYKTIKNTLNNPITDNSSLIGIFSPKIYIEKYKNEFKDYNNNNYLSSITQENPKLTNLLKRIPSNRKSKDKSYDLMDYITNLSKHKYKNQFLPNKSSFNNFEPIYPINKCINSKTIQNNQ